jgi:hypothetical protein
MGTPYGAWWCARKKGPVCGSMWFAIRPPCQVERSSSQRLKSASITRKPRCAIPMVEPLECRLAPATLAGPTPISTTTWSPLTRRESIGCGRTEVGTDRPHFGYRYTETTSNRVFVTVECLYGFTVARADGSKRIVKPWPLQGQDINWAFELAAAARA